MKGKGINESKVIRGKQTKGTQGERSRSSSMTSQSKCDQFDTVATIKAL